MNDSLFLAPGTQARPGRTRHYRDPTSEHAVARWTLTAIALAFLVLVLFLPLVAVFGEALRRGWQVALEAITDPDALSAVRLTLLVAAIAVPLNCVFGVAAAWAIASSSSRASRS